MDRVQKEMSGNRKTKVSRFEVDKLGRIRSLDFSLFYVPSLGTNPKVAIIVLVV